MIRPIVDFLMDQPILYKLVQSTLAGGGHGVIKRYLVKKIPKKAEAILDQGCGTGEYSLLFKNKYFGLDNNEKDIEFAKIRYPGKFFTGTATNMKRFKRNQFDVTFAVGLHHHLTNFQAKKAIEEALRVTKKGGKILIVDAMLPKYSWNLIGLCLRKMDRGRYVRKYTDTLKLLPSRLNIQYEILSSFPFDYIVIEIKK